jgi:hypothetical protein
MCVTAACASTFACFPLSLTITVNKLLGSARTSNSLLRPLPITVPPFPTTYSTAGFNDLWMPVNSYPVLKLTPPVLLAIPLAIRLGGNPQVLVQAPPRRFVGANPLVNRFVVELYPFVPTKVSHHLFRFPPLSYPNTPSMPSLRVSVYRLRAPVYTTLSPADAFARVDSSLAFVLRLISRPIAAWLWP